MCLYLHPSVTVGWGVSAFDLGVSVNRQTRLFYIFTEFNRFSDVINVRESR